MLFWYTHFSGILLNSVICSFQAIDEMELAVLDKVYCKNRKTPLLIGSVKSNTGHSEACAALMSVAKVLIAMETNIIPANIQYNTPNPNIQSLIDGRIEVVTENKEWNGKYAAVNAAGLSASYGHILLKANPKVKEEKLTILPRLLVASTRNEQSIQEILDKVSYYIIFLSTCWQ